MTRESRAARFVVTLDLEIEPSGELGGLEVLIAEAVVRRVPIVRRRVVGLIFGVSLLGL
jgi:hypothetical protein